jgi:rod shape-determining protein MreD
MRRDIRIVVLIAILLAHIFINRYLNDIRIRIDLLYLILIYVAIKSETTKTILVATVIGWLTDFFSGGLIGVFGFARVITSFFVCEFSRFVDISKNYFIFILIALSLALSNLVANIFFHFIYGYGWDLHLLLSQPFFTGALGFLIISSSKIKKMLHVY